MKTKIFIITLFFILQTGSSVLFAQFVGGFYNGQAMIATAGCTYTVSNVHIGGSYDGNSVVATAGCTYTVSNVHIGGPYDGYSKVNIGSCTYTVYNVFIGGSCSGEYASVQVCPTQTWTVPPCAARPPLTLPIELLSFTASPINNEKVLCKWTTETEINNDYFTIEKTKDDRQYEFVGRVKGAGNSSSKLSYQLIDTSPYQGTSYYRLKQTDYDGKFTYSQLVPVNLNGVALISISPNPAEDEFEYKIGSTEKMSVQVKVVDILGQIVINKTENIEKGITSKRLDVSEISSGTYILELITENKEIRGKQFQIK